jgi:hypothetical protein
MMGAFSQMRKPEPCKDRIIKKHAKTLPINVSAKHVTEDNPPQVDPELLRQFKEMHQEKANNSNQGYKEFVYESAHNFQEAEAENIRCLHEFLNQPPALPMQGKLQQ